MMKLFYKISLYLKLVWNHIVFWGFPTPEEDYYLHLGTVYFYLGKYKKAISLFEKSQNAHHYQDASYSKYNCYYLGYSFLNIGNFKKAIEYFEKYLTFNNNDYEVLSYTGWCYLLLNRPSDSLRIYLQGAVLQGDSPYWDVECANILMRLNRKEQALRHLGLAETKTKDSEYIAIIKSLRSKINGNLDDAIKTIRDLIRNNEAHLNTFRLMKVDLYTMLSRFLRELGKTAEAIDILEKAFEDNSKDLWVINELAMEYADQEIKLDKALKLIDRAVIYQPENSIFIDTKGWILYKMGKKEEAKLEIEKSLALNPDCKDTQKHYEQIVT
jgi:tetratricopeptide (TPR) repeat protein